MEFNNIKQLQERLMPALKLRKEQLKKDYINEEYIWNKLKEKWAKEKGLGLSEMVDDILKFID